MERGQDKRNGACTKNMTKMHSSTNNNTRRYIYARASDITVHCFRYVFLSHVDMSDDLLGVNSNRTFSWNVIPEQNEYSTRELKEIKTTHCERRATSSSFGGRAVRENTSRRRVLRKSSSLGESQLVANRLKGRGRVTDML